MSYPHKPVLRNNVCTDIIFYLSLHILCFFFFIMWSSKKSIALLNLLSMIFVSLFYLIRVIVLLREIIMWRKIYSNWAEIFIRSMKMENRISFITAFLVQFLSFCLCLSNTDLNAEEILTGKNYTLLEITICLSNVLMGLYFQWGYCGLLHSYSLEESFSFSGGSCMALGYFYGYLKIILPELLDKINAFQDRNGIQDEKIPVKRLFILIPSSAYVCDKIRNTTSLQEVEPLEEKLEPLKRDRGMVLNRVYKNTMYKIKNERNMAETEYYVALEGVTPLKTFEETCSREKKFRAYKREVITSFYYTLERLLLQDRDVKDFVELIYYDDEKKEMAEVVRKRIRYIVHNLQKHKREKKN